MVDFSKICYSDGTFKADDIILDRLNTIKVFDESETLMVLQFFVPEKKIYINEFWQRKGVQMGHLHTRSLKNGLRFPLLDFVIEILNEYGVTPSQLAPNAWRILGTFYIGRKKEGITPILYHLKRFYYLKSKEKFYFLQSRDYKIVTGLP